jgi:hypothetical protein
MSPRALQAKPKAGIHLDGFKVVTAAWTIRNADEAEREDERCAVLNCRPVCGVSDAAHL